MPVGDVLTSAQRRVLVALCRPYRDAAFATPASNPAIARELSLSVDAVKSTMRALFDLFGIGDVPQNEKRAVLALQALRGGVVSRRDLAVVPEEVVHPGLLGGWWLLEAISPKEDTG